METSAVETTDSVIMSVLADEHPAHDLLRQASRRSMSPSGAVDPTTCGAPVVAVQCGWDDRSDEVVLEDTSGRRTVYSIGATTAPLVEDPAHRAILNVVRAGKLALRSERAKSTTLAPPLDPSFDTDCEQAARRLLEHAQSLTSDGGHYAELDNIQAACEALLLASDANAPRPPSAAGAVVAPRTTIYDENGSIAQVIFDAANAQLQVMRTSVGSLPSLSVHKVPLSVAFLSDVIEEKLATAGRRKASKGEATASDSDAARSEPADVVMAREHRALVQFALEVMDSVEANRVIIADDPQRPDPPRMLSSVRGRIVQVEETLRVQGRAIAQAEQKASLQQLSEAKMLRTLLYKELEQLRGSERVLECCVAEKKKAMQAVHEERASFNKYAVDARTAVKDKQKEIARLVATTAQLRKELSAVHEQLVTSSASARAHAEEVERLRNVLNALRDKKRQGALSPGHSDQGSVGVPSPQRGQRIPREQTPSKLVYDLAAASKMTRSTAESEVVHRCTRRSLTGGRHARSGSGPATRHLF
jgi:hypothetical protein